MTDARSLVTNHRNSVGGVTNVNNNNDEKIENDHNDKNGKKIKAHHGTRLSKSLTRARGSLFQNGKQITNNNNSNSNSNSNGTKDTNDINDSKSNDGDCLNTDSKKTIQYMDGHLRFFGRILYVTSTRMLVLDSLIFILFLSMQ